MAIKAIAFDIDGTLYPDAALRIRVLPFAFRHMALLGTMAAVRRELHARSAAVAATGDRGMPTDLESFRRLQSELAADKLNRPVEETAAYIDENIYGEIENAFGHVPLYEGVRECLSIIREAGLALAVLSDFPVERKLEALGLADFFPVRRTSEECGLLKPAARPFLSLARELGLEPAQVLYVGNSLRFDIVGANSAGMETALRTTRLDAGRRRADNGARPDFAFHRFEDLGAWVLTRTMTSQ